MQNMNTPVLSSVPPHLNPRAHSRTPSRSPTRQRIVDDILSDLSPATTLEAFTSPSGKLRASVEAATASERAFGIRATIASKKIEEWLGELSTWPWPHDGGAEGFETPTAKRRKLSAEYEDERKSRSGYPDKEQESAELELKDEVYMGSLQEKSVLAYERRVEDIHEDMEELDVEEIKRTVLDNFSARSRPSSSASNAAPLPTLLSTYTKMDDFTAVVTATVLQALPKLMRLTQLMEVWTIRLSVLKRIPPLMEMLVDAEVALKSGWQAIQVPRKNDEAGGEKYLERKTYDVMRSVLQDKVTALGQTLDYMLDTLECREDVLPEHWLDRMEAIENDYGEWSVQGDKKVREGEWARMAKRRKEEADKARAKEEAEEIARMELEHGRAVEAARAAAQDAAQSSDCMERECVERAEKAKKTQLLATHLEDQASALQLQVDAARRKAELARIDRESLLQVQREQEVETSRLEAEMVQRNLDTKFQSQLNALDQQHAVDGPSGELRQEHGLVQFPSFNQTDDLARDLSPEPIVGTPSSSALASASRSLGATSYQVGSEIQDSRLRSSISSDGITVDKLAFLSKELVPTFDTDHKASFEPGSSPPCGQLGLVQAFSGNPSDSEVKKRSSSATPPKGPKFGHPIATMLRRASWVTSSNKPQSSSSATAPNTAQSLYKALPSISIPSNGAPQKEEGWIIIEQPTENLTVTQIENQAVDLNRLLLDGSPSPKVQISAPQPSSGVGNSTGESAEQHTTLAAVKRVQSIDEMTDTSSACASGHMTAGQVLPPRRPSGGSLGHSADGANESKIKRSSNIELQIQSDAEESPRLSSAVVSSVEINQQRSRRHSICSNDSTIVNRDDEDVPSPPLAISPPVFGSHISDHFPDFEGRSPSGRMYKISDFAYPNNADATLDNDAITIPTHRKGDSEDSSLTGSTFSSDPTENPWRESSIDPHSNLSVPNPESLTTPVSEVQRSSPLSNIISSSDTEAPSFPNLDVSPTLPSFSKKAILPDNQLQSQISNLLATLPARIRLESEPENEVLVRSPPAPSTPNATHRPATTSSIRRSMTPTMRSYSSLSTRAPTPNFTLAPAYGKNTPRPRHTSAHPEINVYHLSHHGEAPIKLFIRRVGESGERLMVRVGGGWSDLGAYLTEYAAHHGHRVNAAQGDDKIEVQNFGTVSASRSVSMGGKSPARSRESTPMNGRNSPAPGARPVSVLERERPISSLYVRKTRRSIGEQTESSAAKINIRSPSTPLPAGRQNANGEHGTPPARSSSRLSGTWTEDEIGLGLAGPSARPKAISEESKEWVQNMTEKVKAASAEKEEKNRKSYGELGGGVGKRLFRKSGGGV